MTEQPLKQIPDAILQNLRHAAEAERDAAAVADDIQAVNAVIAKLETDLGNARHSKLQLEDRGDEANRNATLYLRAAQTLALDEKIPNPQLEAAQMAARTAAAQPPQEDTSGDPAPWELAMCRCGQKISWDPNNRIWGHPTTGKTACDDGQQAHPVSVEDPLGQNGHMPSPEGAPR